MHLQQLTINNRTLFNLIFTSLNINIRAKLIHFNVRASLKLVQFVATISIKEDLGPKPISDLEDTSILTDPFCFLFEHININTIFLFALAPKILVILLFFKQLNKNIFIMLLLKSKFHLDRGYILLFKHSYHPEQLFRTEIGELMGCYWDFFVPTFFLLLFHFI